MRIDMWYGDSVKDAESVTVYFNDLAGTYAGNIYKGGEAIGDFSTADSVEIEKTFSHLNFSFD